MSGPARGFRPRRSGRPPPAGATTASGHGATSHPTRRAARSAPVSAARPRSAATRGEHLLRAPSTWRGTSGSGSRAPTGPTPTTLATGASGRATPARASCAAGRTSTARAPCAAPSVGRSSPPHVTPMSAFASSVRQPSRGSTSTGCACPPVRLCSAVTRCCTRGRRPPTSYPGTRSSSSRSSSRSLL